MRRYGDFTAVDGVSFNVQKGVCYGLLGPNGAGKTSTIGILAGLVTPHAGTVTLDGMPLTPNAFQVKRKIGYVPQELAVYDDLSSRANLEFFGGLYGLEGDESKKQVDRALQLSGLADKGKMPVRDYSGGMRRRLNIAASLLQNPSLLILDEPTVGVDPQSRNAIFDALEALLSEGMTLIYTTHYMEEVERMCDRIAIMDEGKIVAEDAKEGLYRVLPTTNSLTISFEDPTGVLDRARSVGFQAELLGAQLTLRSDDLSGALAWAASVGKERKIESIQTHRATLEEVFLHLTGKSLRDRA